MIKVILDWESAYGISPTGRNVTLSKMTTEEYVRDKEFKVHGLGVKIDAERPKYIWRRDELKTFLRTFPWHDAWVICHHCLPGDTEVLTKGGWGRIADVPDTEEIMQWDPKTEALTWVHPTEKIVGWSDSLITWDTSFHKGSYTSEHRMFYRTPDVKGWRVALAKDVAAMSQNNVYVPLSGVYSPEYGFPEVSPEIARLMEAVRADGSLLHRGGRCYGARFKVSKARKIGRALALLKGAGVPTSAIRSKTYDKYTCVWCVSNPVTDIIFKLLTKKKVYGLWVLGLSVVCREAILDEARYWDGHQRKSKLAYSLSTVDPQTAEAFEIMAHCTGQSVSGAWRDNNRGFGSGCNRPLWTASVRKRSQAKLVQTPKTTTHNGKVYCFTVPTGAFMVRAGGRVGITGNSHFDGAILSWIFGIRPKMWGCTLSMARALFPHESHSLSNISKLLKVGEKGFELHSVKDKWQLTEHDQGVLEGYCATNYNSDINLTARIFDRLKKHIPIPELRLIDSTVRLFTEPVLEVNPEPLIISYKHERRTKRALIKQCCTDKTVLASADKFAALLMDLGIDPPKKLSPSKVKDGRVDPDEAGEAPMGLLPSFKAVKGMTPEQKAENKEAKRVYPWAYAFGKTDELFKMLLDHPDLKIQAVVDARMGVKSTIKETRSKRFYKIGTRGAFPVYLNYYGAHTNRWSGGDRQNVQNMNRVDDRDPQSGALRRSLIAPDRHSVVVRDLGQIEARNLAYIAGQEDMLDVYRADGDPYCHMASQIYGHEVDKKDKLKRAVGKLLVLGCGYGMGWAKLQESARVGFMGMDSIMFGEEYVAALGVDVEVFCMSRSYKKGYALQRDASLSMKPLNVSEEDHLMHCAVTKHLVDLFRSTNHKVILFWKECQNALAYILAGQEIAVGRGGVIKTGKKGFQLPSGMWIRYSKLKRSTKGEYSYLANRKKKEWTRIYGGKAVENLVQGMSRIILSDQMQAIEKRLKAIPLREGEVARVVTTTHDEVVVVVPTRLAAAVFALMGVEMSKPPSWCADLPLKSSGGYAKSYGDCEK